MSQVTKDDARERRLRSLDTIAVKNITAEDIIFENDKLGPQPERVLVPKAQKDIGHGRGINHLPRYQAQRFTKNLIEQIINKKAKDEWDDRKKELRMLTRDERNKIQETETVRTNDVATWGELFPKIWLGVVRKFGGDALPEPVDATIPDSGNPMTDVMNKSNLADKPYEPDTKNE